MDADLQAMLQRGDLEGVRARLSSPTELQLRDAQDATVLHWAARMGAVAIAEWLITQGLSPADVDQNGETPLHYAVRAGQVDMVRYLLQIAPQLVHKASLTGATPCTWLHTGATWRLYACFARPKPTPTPKMKTALPLCTWLSTTATKPWWSTSFSKGLMCTSLPTRGFSLSTGLPLRAMWR